MNAYNSIIDKFRLTDFQLSDLPVYSTTISKRKIKKIQLYSSDKINSFILTQLKISKFFWISLWLFLISFFILIIIAILKEWIKISIPMDYNILFIIVGFFFTVFAIGLMLNNKALKKIQIGRILLSIKTFPDYIWQHSETEFQPTTIAIVLKEQLVVIDTLNEDNSNESTEDIDSDVDTYNFENISSWSLNAKIVYHKETYSITSAGAKSSHDLYMMVIGFFLEVDPYSVINPEFRIYLDELSLKLSFSDGKKYTLNVFSHHVNREYGLRGYEDFEIKLKRFRKMQNLIKCGIILNKECPEKGSFNEVRI